MAYKAKPQVAKPVTPGRRSSKAASLDRKDTTGSKTAPNTSSTPVRDVREDPDAVNCALALQRGQATCARSHKSSACVTC